MNGVLTYEPHPVPARIRVFRQSDAVRRISGQTFPTQLDFNNWCGDATDDQLIQIVLAWTDLYPKTPADINPNELVLFDDYREISPRVWIPFRETRTFPHWAAPGKSGIIRSELRVEEARTDVDLTERMARLMPREGDHVQDQRFLVAVDFNYRASLSDDEIRSLCSQCTLPGQ